MVTRAAGPPDDVPPDQEPPPDPELPGDLTLLGRLPKNARETIGQMLGLSPAQIDTVLQLVGLPENSSLKWWT